MSTLSIVFYQNPRIRDKSQLLSQPLDIRDSISRMRETMKAHDGIGIAAPQIGELVRAFLVAKELFPDLTLPSDVFINPKILRKGFKRVEGEEGCLSVPKVFGIVPRAVHITVEAYDQNWKKFKFAAHGLLARVVQHELDHLDGILFIDRAVPESLHEVMYDKEGKEIFRPWKL